MDGLEKRGALRLFATDYRAFSEQRGESKARRRLLAVPHMLTNPCLHLALLVRLAASSPRWIHWLWRNILIAKHSSEVGRGFTAGPGLVLLHPLGFLVDSRTVIGSNAIIYHNVSIGLDLKGEAPAVGDDVIILSGVMIIGPVKIGSGSLIGAHAFVDYDVPEGSLVGRDGIQPLPPGKKPEEIEPPGRRFAPARYHGKRPGEGPAAEE